jgi:hypothetical protein
MPGDLRRAVPWATGSGGAPSALGPTPPLRVGGRRGAAMNGDLPP